MSNTGTQTDITPQQTLDAKGLNCPLPILKAKLLLNKMQPGEILYVQATDPHASIDFEAYCARTGHEILEETMLDGVTHFYIKRAAQPRRI